MNDNKVEVEITDPVKQKKVSDLQIEVRTHEDKVIINFGEIVRWVGIDKATALSLAEALIHHALKVPNADA